MQRKSEVILNPTHGWTDPYQLPGNATGRWKVLDNGRLAYEVLVVNGRSHGQRRTTRQWVITDHIVADYATDKELGR